MLNDSLAGRFAQRFVDSPKLIGRVLRVLRIDCLSDFFDQGSQFRSRFNVTSPPFEALLVSFNDRSVNCQGFPPEFSPNFLASALTRVNAVVARPKHQPCWCIFT